MSDDTLDAERTAMVADIAEQVAGTARWLGKAELEPRVMAAMERVPREEFVPESQRAHAYENRPLPIGHGQTISQPYMVAVMTDLTGAGPGDRVLEVGTGCGYQSAVLAETGAEVDSVEVVPSLAEQAQARLARLGYDSVTVHVGDGSKGWPDKAPYRAIVVTAASSRGMPPALVDQLDVGGRLVIPIEDPGAGSAFFGPSQSLIVAVKQPDGSLEERTVLPVAFVPLI
jgi:protein-L-isoaspartate(D-aspartate) O-methyltransferase